MARVVCNRALALAGCFAAGTLLAACQGGGAPSTPTPAGKAPAAGAQAPAGAPTAAAPAAAAYTYNPSGRRDPFRPLVVPRVATARPKTGLASLDPQDLKLTGIVWDQRGFYYALVEAANGIGYVIRANDLIGDEARVTKITPEGLTLEIETRAELPREKSQKRLVEIRLRKEEEQ